MDVAASVSIIDELMYSVWPTDTEMVRSIYVYFSSDIMASAKLAHSIYDSLFINSFNVSLANSGEQVSFKLAALAYYSTGSPVCFGEEMPHKL